MSCLGFYTMSFKTKVYSFCTSLFFIIITIIVDIVINTEIIFVIAIFILL